MKRLQRSTRNYQYNMIPYNRVRAVSTIYNNVGTEICGWGTGGLYLTLHCHHRNDFAFRWAAVRAVLIGPFTLATFSGLSYL